MISVDFSSDRPPGKETEFRCCEEMLQFYCKEYPLIFRKKVAKLAFILRESLTDVSLSFKSGLRIVLFKYRGADSSNQELERMLNINSGNIVFLF